MPQAVGPRVISVVRAQVPWALLSADSLGNLVWMSEEDQTPSFPYLRQSPKSASVRTIVMSYPGLRNHLETHLNDNLASGFPNDGHDSTELYHTSVHKGRGKHAFF